MKKLRGHVTFVLIMALSTAVFAQADSKTQQMLDEITAKTEAVKSYKVDMKTTTVMMGQPMLTEGEMTFKEPDKMYMKSTANIMGGMTQEVFSSGDIVWTYVPLMKMATKMDLRKMKEQDQNAMGVAKSSDITKPFEGLATEKIRYIETKETDAGEVCIFVATADYVSRQPSETPMPQMLPKEIEFHMVAETGLPSKVIMKAEDGSIMLEQTYSNFRINIPIDDSVFAFTPPKDAQVMDMTESAMNMMKQTPASQ